MNLYEKYILASVHLYGVIHEDQLKEKILVNDPKIESFSYSEEFLEENFIQKKGDYFVDESLSSDEAMEEFMDQTKDKPFYDPSEEELLRYMDLDYFVIPKSYLELENFLEGRTRWNASEVAFELKNHCFFGLPYRYMLERLNEVGFRFKNNQEKNDILKLLENLNHQLKRWTNRGFSDEELKIETKKPKYIIEPNDLCPCGSGKKYKDCCLKKKSEISQIPMTELKYEDRFFEKEIDVNNFIDEIEDTLTQMKEVLEESFYHDLFELYLRYLAEGIDKSIKASPKMIALSFVIVKEKMDLLSYQEEKDKVISFIEAEKDRVEIEKLGEYLYVHIYALTEEQIIQELYDEMNELMRLNGKARYKKIPKNHPLKSILSRQKSTKIDLYLEGRAAMYSTRFREHLDDASDYIYNLIDIYPLSYHALTDLGLFIKKDEDFIDLYHCIIQSFEIVNKEILKENRNDFYKYPENRYYLLAIDNLGLLYKKMGRLKEAYTIYQKGLQYDKENYLLFKDRSIFYYFIINQSDRVHKELEELHEDSVYYLYLSLFFTIIFSESPIEKFIHALEKYPNTMKTILFEESDDYPLAPYEYEFLMDFIALFDRSFIVRERMERLYEIYGKK